MRSLTRILFLLALPLALSSCSSSTPPPTVPQILSARDKAELVVTLATQALDAFDREVSKLHAAGLLKPETSDQLAESAAHVRQVLDGLREGDPVTREQALEAIDRASAMVALARSAGAQLPIVTDQALSLARELVEE